MATNTEKPNMKILPEDNPNANNASSTQPSFLQPPPSDATSTPGAAPREATESKGPSPVFSGNDAPLSDVQKKKLRAERFGISVQMSEQEKRNSRAERFGTASTLQVEASKSEELKRKARAERFGIPTALDEDAKKKARLARFASVSKTDPLEEDKRKTRALRFSNLSTSSLLQANGNENIEPKAAIAGKAGGGA